MQLCTCPSHGNAIGETLSGGSRPFTRVYNMACMWSRCRAALCCLLAFFLACYSHSCSSNTPCVLICCTLGHILHGVDETRCEHKAYLTTQTIKAHMQRSVDVCQRWCFFCRSQSNSENMLFWFVVTRSMATTVVYVIWLSLVVWALLLICVCFHAPCICGARAQWYWPRAHSYILTYLGMPSCPVPRCTLKAVA